MDEPNIMPDEQPARSPADFKVYLHFKRKPTETKYEVLKSVAILGLVLDRRCELLGMTPGYESVFKKKVVTGGRTVTVIVDMGEKLLEDAAKVAADLSAKYPQFGSSTEWKHRAAMFQHLPVKYLQDIREDMQTGLESLKHTESLVEVNRAYKYLAENCPDMPTDNFEDASKRWLAAMLTLRNGGFSFYAAREAADHIAFTQIDKTKSYARYHYIDEVRNLPATWDDSLVKAWREAEQASTEEREAMDADDEENKRQREALKPMLTKLISQGMSNQQIQATLEAQKRPRQFISDLMGDVGYLRFTGVEKHKPPKIEVIMSSAKEDQPAKDPSKQVPKCPEGQYWDHEQGKCLPIKPPEPEPQGKETAKEPKPEPWNKPTILYKDQIDSANKPSY